MSVYPFLGWLAGVGLLSFSGGLFLFKVKSRWCPDCGAWTTVVRPAYPNEDDMAIDGHPLITERHS